MTLALVSFIILPSLVLADQTDAATAISSAKQQIVTCYEAVRAAEVAGANVASLTRVLSNAGALLSDSELAYSKNDFDTAFNLAVQSREYLSNFVSEANALGYAAFQKQSSDFLINVGSVVGTFAVVGASVAIWLFLKKRYAQFEEQTDESPRV
jgi:hypothetical protein